MSYRPLHFCNNCGYTWHSRGGNFSLKCPNCGSRDHSHHSRDYSIGGPGIVQTLQGLIVLGLIGLIGYGFITSVMKSSPSTPSTPTEKPSVLPPSQRSSYNSMKKPPCQIWAEANPSLSDKLQPGDSCYGF